MQNQKSYRKFTGIIGKYLNPPLENFVSKGGQIILFGEDGFAGKAGELQVIVSAAMERDGKWWVHISVFKPDAIPEWIEMVKIKEAILGEDVEAYQVIPPLSKYVNINPNVLHLWHCPGRKILPDFTRGGKSI